MPAPTKQITAAMIAILAAIALGASAQGDEKFKKLNSAQIQAKFAGMELTDR